MTINNSKNDAMNVFIAPRESWFGTSLMIHYIVIFQTGTGSAINGPVIFLSWHSRWLLDRPDPNAWGRLRLTPGFFFKFPGLVLSGTCVLLPVLKTDFKTWSRPGYNCRLNIDKQLWVGVRVCVWCSWPPTQAIFFPYLLPGCQIFRRGLKQQTIQAQ